MEGTRNRTLESRREKQDGTRSMKGEIELLARRDRKIRQEREELASVR